MTLDDNLTNNMIEISGSIGMVKLFKNDKNVYIFYDDHSNISYCKNSNSVFLYDIFDKIIENSSDYVILLEEPFVSNYSNIKFLWNNTPHVIKFRNFYKKIISKCADKKKCKVFPVDVRLILCDVSMDELISNINNDEYFSNYNVTLQEYFKYILHLFDKGIDEQINNKDIEFLKKVFDKFKHDIYYIKLKEQFNIFYDKFINLNKCTLFKDFLKKNSDDNYTFSAGYPFENETNEIDKTNNIFLDQYDKLINGIMELYTYILLSGMNYKNIIIYSGYYHSNNLSYILKKYCNYDNKYTIGNVVDIEKKSEETIKNCLLIDKKIFKL